MIKETKNIFKLFFTLFIGATVIVACESEADQLGSQFFQTGTAQGTEEGYDVIIFNKFNNDSIQADNDKLAEATLGAFNEPNFGMQKSSYVTQVRLNTYNPDFGASPEVDSVVLQMKPVYHSVTDSVKTTTYEDYVHPDGNVAAKKVITTYPVKKYGNAKIGGSATNFTVNVHEVNEFLNSTETNFYSDKQVALGALLGSKTFDGYLRAIKITKDSDNTELFSRDAALRVPLDKTFFQEKIINKKGSFELKDAASFIRYFKGIRISVQENDGYIFSFTPNDVSITVYYKYDKTENSTTTRTQNNFSFDFGASNVRFNEIKYNRPSAFTNAMTTSSQVTGDPKIYLQGMGGPGAEVKIPAAIITKLRDLYKNQKAGILSAKIRLYTDNSSWNSTYAKPSTFVTLFKKVTTENNVSTTTESFLDDLSAFQYTNIYKMVNAVDLDKNPAYYEIGITQTVKNMVEKDEVSDKSILLNVGAFQTSSSGMLGKDYTTRAYTPNRIVLLGTDPNLDSNPNPADTKYAQLIVTYSKK